MKRMATKLPPQTEESWQEQVEQLARLNRWRVYHTRYSFGSSKGFPDLVLVRERIIYAELKRDGKDPTPEQRDWLLALERAGGEVYLWHPAQWHQVVAILSGIKAEGR